MITHLHIAADDFDLLPKIFEMMYKSKFLSYLSDAGKLTYFSYLSGGKANPLPTELDADIAAKLTRQWLKFTAIYPAKDNGLEGTWREGFELETSVRSDEICTIRPYWVYYGK